MVEPAEASGSNTPSDALALEAIEFSRSVSTGATETDAEVQALQRDLSVNGLSNSGPRHVREMEIRFAKLGENVVQKAIAKRKELGRRFPDLLTQQQLDQLRDKLRHHVDVLVESQRTRTPPALTLPSGASEALARRAEQQGSGIIVKITQELEALRLEGRLGLYAEEKRMTFNISNSTIAGLNLGTVVGDLTASVETLNSHGQKDFANVVQTLAEALAASVELQNDHRKELLEHLSFVSTEIALPPEKRKMGPLKSSIVALREGLANVAQLAALWPPAEQVLKTMGILS